MPITDSDVKTVVETQESLDLRRKAGVPEIDPDGLPSSYCLKLQACLNTRIKKLNLLKEPFDKAKLDATQERNLGIIYTCSGTIKHASFIAKCK